MRHDDPHYRFIALLLAGESTQARAQLQHPAWNWDTFAQTAADNAILPPLHSAVQSPELAPLLPTEVHDFLSSYGTLNAARNRQILSELESHAALLNQSGIEPIVLKGLAYILTGVYPDPAHRYLHDIDLLIPATQIDLAEHLLRTRGFTPDIADPAVLARHHRPRLVHPGSATVELHHLLGLDSHTALLPPADFIRLSRPFSLGRAIIRIPHPGHLLVHHILHSQLQHSYDHRIWPPLRAQYDLLLLTRHFAAELDWTAIRERFRQQRHAGLLDLHLLQVHDVLGLPLPYPIAITGLTRLRRLRRRLLWRIPAARLADPLFLLSMLVTRKISLIARLLTFPEGRRYVLGAPFRAATYRKVLALLSR